MGCLSLSFPTPPYWVRYRIRFKGFILSALNKNILKTMSYTGCAPLAGSADTSPNGLVLQGSKFLMMCLALATKRQTA